MKKFLNNNSWWFYFVLTFMLSWTIWITGKLFLPQNLSIIVLIAGAFGPFVAAVLILKTTGRGDILKKWLAAIFSFRVGLIWFLLAGIIFPFLIASIHHLIYIALGGTSGVEFNSGWLSYFFYLIPTALLTGGNEEPGWRGYITPILMERFHPLLACTITGIGWAVWHIPMYFVGDWGGGNQPFFWFLIYCIPLSIILTWLYLRSSCSVIPVMLLHAGTNVVFRYFPIETRIFDNISDEFTLIKTAV